MFNIFRWSATIRTSDLDGLYLDKAFNFTLLNMNDPPRSAIVSVTNLSFLSCIELTFTYILHLTFTLFPAFSK